MSCGIVSIMSAKTLWVETELRTKEAIIGDVCVNEFTYDNTVGNVLKELFARSNCNIGHGNLKLPPAMLSGASVMPSAPSQCVHKRQLDSPDSHVGFVLSKIAN